MRGIFRQEKLTEQDMFSRADIRKLLIPLMLEQLLNVLIGLADTIMVSGNGEAAVAGVSLVDNVNLLLINIFTSLAAGGAVVTGQYLGKKDLKGASLSAKLLFYVVLITSGSLTLLCLVFRTGLLRLIFGSVEADVMRNAQIYFLFTALCYPFLGLYNSSAAVLRAQGNAKASLNTSIVMNLVNVTGNAILILGFHMGVAGAALATLISRIVGAVLMQIALGSRDCILPRPKLFVPEWDGQLVRSILRVGIPNGLEGGMFQLGKLMLVSVVSGFGTVSIAANAVANSLSSFHVLPGQVVGLCMVSLVGRCVGAHRIDQARLYTRYLMRLSFLLMGALNLLMLFTLRLQLAPYHLSEETMSLASLLLIIHGAGCIVMWSVAFVLPHALRAAGDTLFVMKVSAGSMLVFRVLLGYVLSAVIGFGVTGVWIAMQVDWVCRIIYFVHRYRGRAWETKAVV